MRKMGLTLFVSGCMGFLIGGAGLDGQTFTASAILTAASFILAAVGYRIYEKSERGEEDKAAEEINTRPKEATFQVWLTAGRLDV